MHNVHIRQGARRDWIRKLTMRLSGARFRKRPTKLIYPDHRLPPWLTEDTTRDRSNRLLDDFAMGSSITRRACRRGIPALRATLAPRNAGLALLRVHFR